jgi:hypothetical protein
MLFSQCANRLPARFQASINDPEKPQIPDSFMMKKAIPILLWGWLKKTYDQYSYSITSFSTLVSPGN